MAALLRRGLMTAGWAVDLAGDATDARHAVTATPYDVIVCDIGLPNGESGLDWCRWLRQAGIWTPVLLLTARTSVEDRIAGLDCGADDYLGKPFSFGELAARLRALLRRGETVRPVTLDVGALHLDPARRAAAYGDAALDLSPREFSLLEYLMRRADDVVTRTDILNHVWDYAYDGVSNVVEVYVSYLRRRFADAGAPNLIETVRGVGYRLRAPGAIGAGGGRHP